MRIIENIRAKFNGWKDGKMDFPLKYYERSPYIKKISEEGNSAINHINGQWQKADANLKTQWMNRVEDKKASENTLNDARKSYENATDEYLCQNTEEDSAPIKLSRKFKLYYFLLPLFVTADIYLTVIVFRIFGESDFLNLIFGLILGVILATFSHKLGEKLASTGKKYDKIFIASALIMLFTVCIAFGVLRGIYISNTDVKDFSYVLFSVLNLFFLFAALFYSYKLHTPGLLKLKEAEVNLSKSEKKYNETVKRKNSSYTLREKRNRVFHSKAERIVNRVNHLLHIYWQKNIRRRNTQIAGEYNPKEISLRIPTELMNPEWESKPAKENKYNNVNGNYFNKSKNKYENS